MTSATLNRKSRIPIFIGLCILAASILYPVFFLAIAAFRPRLDYLRDPLGFPHEWTFANILSVWNGYGAGAAFLRSLLVVSTALVIVLVLAILAGYALAKFNPPFAKVITGSFVSVMLVPGQVLILPIYLMLSAIGLVGSYASVILLYVATSLPFAVFFLSLSFRSLGDELLDAARVDGAGFFRTLLQIVIPMAKPSIATLAVLQFLGMWNELLYALILLPDDSKRLLTPALSMIGEKLVNNQPLVSAGLLIAASVPLLLLSLTSKYVVEGISIGSSK
ncbi:MAG: carbohydrate ABC transporter permease [Microbacterium sp.]|uniref:carbohydrate ABC transporter permease n=1 Tax=Microbacterium sp. TaxID=51671 RepID=UPI001AD56E6E|nr:carbohydrate ABC transporter permease [Microbacterium sp.]MBN9153461.1 carbohydrate ABC transporter permease [Microbacterium sp.]MBN9181080.1 carbohydrate ABC transporter permease [Microbacterium sp.]